MEIMARILTRLAEQNVSTDIQEYLVYGNPAASVAPKALEKAVMPEIEPLHIHYDGTIMYGNRLVDAIHWAQSHGIVFPDEIHNACINPIQHFRMERERLKETT